MKKNVPLVVYDSLGVRTVIGNVDVEQTENGGFEMSGFITDDRFSHLVTGNPDNYSIGFTEEDGVKDVVETAVLRGPVVNGNLAFKATVEINPEREANEEGN